MNRRERPSTTLDKCRDDSSPIASATEPFPFRDRDACGLRNLPAFIATQATRKPPSQAHPAIISFSGGEHPSDRLPSRTSQPASPHRSNVSSKLSSPVIARTPGIARPDSWSTCVTAGLLIQASTASPTFRGSDPYGRTQPSGLLTSLCVKRCGDSRGIGRSVNLPHRVTF